MVLKIYQNLLVIDWFTSRPVFLSNGMFGKSFVSIDKLNSLKNVATRWMAVSDENLEHGGKIETQIMRKYFKKIEDSAKNIQAEHQKLGITTDVQISLERLLQILPT